MEKKFTRIFKILSILFCSIVIAYGDSSTSVKIVQAEEVAINEANFPDENFRDYVLNCCDTDKNEVLSEEEIKNTIWILVNEKGIADLKGIENFTNLTKLQCYSNQLTSLDVSKNTKLTELWCYSNYLSSIETGENTNLTEVLCYSNYLTSIDVSKNPNLLRLSCNFNQLTSIDVSKNSSLNSLECSSNQLTSLDISQNPSLTKLSCDSNQLTSLDVSKNPNLTSLSCNFNQLASLNVNKNPGLTELWCDSNQLESLDISKNPNLILLFCSSNQLTSLDVSQNPNLTEISCNFNQLTSLDVSKNLSLSDLNCYSNQLTNLEIGKNPNLKYLFCYLNQLTSLDVSQSPNLSLLYCYSNQLTSLNVSKNPGLTQLWCHLNQLTSLDIGQSSNLVEVFCNSNQLTSLKLNKQIYDEVLLTKQYLHGDYVTLSNLSNITEATDGTVKVIDVNKPATYQYEYNGKKNDFTILYVDSDENPEKTYKISYVLNGGMNAAENPSTYVEGIGVGSFASATKIDAIFDGWYLDAAFTQKVISIEASQTGDITLYAKFITSVLNPVVTSSCTRFFYDYEYKNSVSGTAITLYGNCKKNTDTIKKDVILYTDILASYQYTLGGNGKVKASTGKVVAGITMSDTKPALNRGKIIDNAAAKIAKAKIKHGQITITSVGKMAGTVYLWVMDTGKKEVAECYPIQVKLAPKKLEVQALSGKKVSKLKMENGNSASVQVVGFAGSVKTTDCEYVPTVDSRSENYVSIEKIAYSDADGNPVNNVFSIKGIGLKNKKDTKVSITFTCKENGKKIKFTTIITKTAVK